MQGTSSKYNGGGHRWLGFLLAVAFLSTSTTQVQSFQSQRIAIRIAPRGLYASPESDVNDEVEGESTVSPVAITVDDGGSDLTDRFKYKVHALMGTYDPPAGAVNDENQTGNIIGAMLKFPTEYTFTVVGKAADSAGEQYASDVKQALVSVLGSDAKMEMRAIPRGKKFTRVSAKLTVESASVISSIYEELDALEATVMKF